MNVEIPLLAGHAAEAMMPKPIRLGLRVRFARPWFDCVNRVVVHKLCPSGVAHGAGGTDGVLAVELGAAVGQGVLGT